MDGCSNHEKAQRQEALSRLRQVHHAYRVIEQLLDEAATPTTIEVDRLGFVSLLNALNETFEARLAQAEDVC